MVELSVPCEARGPAIIIIHKTVLRTTFRGWRYCHGELVHWRKEKRRVRKLALLNAKQRRTAR